VCQFFRRLRNNVVFPTNAKIRINFVRSLCSVRVSCPVLYCSVPQRYVPSGIPTKNICPRETVPACSSLSRRKSKIWLPDVQCRNCDITGFPAISKFLSTSLTEPCRKLSASLARFVPYRVIFRNNFKIRLSSYIPRMGVGFVTRCP
jgi:hypothetical protein